MSVTVVERRRPVTPCAEEREACLKTPITALFQLPSPPRKVPASHTRLPVSSTAVSIEHDVANPVNAVVVGTARDIETFKLPQAEQEGKEDMLDLSLAKLDSPIIPLNRSNCLNDSSQNALSLPDSPEHASDHELDNLEELPTNDQPYPTDGSPNHTTSPTNASSSQPHASSAVVEASPSEFQHIGKDCYVALNMEVGRTLQQEFNNKIRKRICGVLRRLKLNDSRISLECVMAGNSAATRIHEADNSLYVLYFPTEKDYC